MSALGLADAKSALEAAGFPVFYGDEGDWTQMPYVVFYQSGSSTFQASNRTFASFGEYTAMLYCPVKSPEAERALEGAIDAMGAPWDRDGDIANHEEGWTRVDYTFPAWSTPTND